jgi:hypothetical protein
MTVPEDEIDRRVKKAVQEALAAERRSAAERQANDAQNLARLKRETELLALEKLPRTWGALAVRRTRNVFLGALAVLLVGFVFPLQMGLAALGASPSGYVLCPLQCDDCSGPGRMFNWRYRGGWKSNKGSMGTAFICEHPSLDVENMTWADVASRRNDALQPYLLSGFVTYPVDAICLALLAAALFGVRGTTKALRHQEARRAELTQQMRGG